MSFLSGDLARVGCFALFVLWLTAFPMSGPLLDHGRMAWFLWPHVVTLLACARFASGPLFRFVLTGGTVLTALLTVGFAPLATSAANPLLLLLGIASAPLTIYLNMLLKTGTRPVLLAALGLAIGNFATIGLDLLPLASEAKLALLAGALPGVLLVSTPCAGLSEGETPGLFRYLLFILFFQVVSGLMYGQMFPVYGEVAVLPGIELVFYALAAFGTVRLATRDPQLTLLLGVAAAMFAFALWHLLPWPIGHQVGLFVMMVAAGIVDLFLLARILAYGNQLRAAGYGLGALVGGIAVGDLLASRLGAASHTVTLVALVVLNLAVIVLFTRREGGNAAATPDALPDTATSPDLPDSLQQLLSEQERQVLLAVLQRHTYREVAQTLSISESSVKTYMQRIYRKTGVYNKQGLRELIDSSLPGQPGTVGGDEKESQKERSADLA